MIRTATVAAAVCAVVGVGVAPSAAAPATAPTTAPATSQPGTMGCQPVNVALYYWFYTSSGALDYRMYDCSGNKGLNSDGYAVDAGSWSGYVRFSGGSWTWFCDNEVLYLEGRRVVRLDIAASRITECGGLASADGQNQPTDGQNQLSAEDRLALVGQGS
ncbi:hypothetical protein [Streptomyces sp. SBT349]|uniref:hypothetical protein n=1 Tax=Streptomyces sp. SBT349 TaxID=1580539 RepID=UPI000B283433|nr:hypothetical protein [Streptomyces sp. SBT349]